MSTRPVKSVSLKSVLAAILGICLLGFSSHSFALKILNGRPKNKTSVLEYHNGPRRDGVYVDKTLTRASARLFHLDRSFKAQIKGEVYAQLL